MKKLFNADIVIPVYRADVGDVRGIYFCGALALMTCFLTLLLWEILPPGLVGLLLHGASCFAVYALTNVWRQRLMRSGRGWWCVGDSGVVAVMPWSCSVLAILPYGVAALGIPVWLAIMFLGGYVPWMAAGGLIYMGATGAVHLAGVVRQGGPVRPAVSVDREGVWFRQVDGASAYIPWRKRPRLDCVRAANAVVTYGNGQELVYEPGMALLLSYRQLARLLETFSTSASHRRRLNNPDRALDCVLEVLEPTEEEYADRSWTWARPTPQA